MRSSAMDPSFSGFVLDPSKCSKLSMEERRDLVYELSKWPQGAPEMLQSWSRRDLLEILCAEMGKDRKYTGLTKYKMIEHLLRIVSEKKSDKRVEDIDSNSQLPPPNTEISSKRQRKTIHPSRLPIETNHLPVNKSNEVVNNSLYCQNIACRATLSLEDAFCRRCSCCICYKYDDNKDPSLWLVCSSDFAAESDSCGISCHLECALNDERAGITKKGHRSRVDGNFHCVSCGKKNDLFGCWRKQLIIAKDARRVDVLCYRVSLSHRLLYGAEKYAYLHEIVDSAIKKLEVEVGPINGLPLSMGRGIVNRLSCGAEVQKLCGLAIESLDSMLASASHLSPDHKMQERSLLSSRIISFEVISPTSLAVVVGSEVDTLFSRVVSYSVWHRKADMADYRTEPTCKLISPSIKFLVSELTPDTEYVFKVIAFSETKELGMWENEVTTCSVLKDVQKGLSMDGGSPNLHCSSPKKNNSSLSNPPSEGDDSNNSVACGDLNKLPDNYCGYCEKSEIPDLEKSPEKNSSREISQPHENSMGALICWTEATEQEETPGHSVSALDEEPNSATIQTDSHRDSTYSSGHNQTSDVPKSENKSNAAIGNVITVLPYGSSNSVLPVTPAKLETNKEVLARSFKTTSGGGLENWFPKPEKELKIGSSSKNKGLGRCEEIYNKGGSLEDNYEYCVKMVRWLECEGLIETNFRVKFLTWFSLRATPQERRVVSVFVDTLIDDPPSLAGQLVDTFFEGISSKRPLPVPSGFCMQLWH